MYYTKLVSTCQQLIDTNLTTIILSGILLLRR
nr:MAG TPA: hypothetical protein [Caudoviricetes sp.]DAR19069.1 MAG TPA: hypothetical protein [Caudoviricetes sp.]